MSNARYVNELEVKHLDGDNPSVFGGGGEKIGVVEHAFDVLCIDLNSEVVGTNEP